MGKDKKATIFEFTSYQFEPSKKGILFNYKTEFNDGSALFFTETIILPKTVNPKKISTKEFEKLLESLHIILGISYYKFYCATKVKFKYILSKKEADFWNTVYKKGLGEFFYRNNLDPKISPKFNFSKNKVTDFPEFNFSNSKKCLLGIGGGKDSIVAGELLKESGFEITALSIQTNKKSDLIDEVIKTMGVNELKIQRFLDDKVFDNHQYNGHLPISAIYAFLGSLACYLYEYPYFIVGNEYSSNFGNVKFKGEEINHQWSKSFEFEKLFQNYVSTFISGDVFYFSLLRNFYEIRVVKMFSNYKKYFSLFSSCNGNFRKNNVNKKLWCCQCPKCVFVFILLSAFLNKPELINIFGKNLYQEEKLLDVFKDVLGFGKMKPFDCVGTFEESQTAMFLAKGKFADDFIIRQLGDKAKHYPEVLRTSNQSIAPEIFKFLGLENALILGYGKEGKISEEYLKKYYPKIKIAVGDASIDKNYLKNQKDSEIAIKTPGIKKELVTIPYTTATNIFFAQVLGNNTIIGVTGSKGKSTTSSLIFEILKEAGKNVELLGNIGKPMLEYLLNPIKKDTIFVLELSSYQLDDIKFSPDIAVVTNLFPEHMDFHGSLENYYKAKRNIVRFQNKNNYFIHNVKTKSWLKDYKGKPVLFSQEIYQSNLIGEHNKSNIGAAVSVAKILGIKDSVIKNAVKKFVGLPHRLEFVGEFKKIKFYDDAISTTPESTIMAIKSLPNIGTIFLGGQDRGYDFSDLEKTIKKYKINNVVLFPDSGNKIFKSTKNLNILKTDKMKEAVDFAYKNTKPGQICLLSCASPSYSLWKNFEEKGGQFKREVNDQSSK